MHFTTLALAALAFTTTALAADPVSPPAPASAPPGPGPKIQVDELIPALELDINVLSRNIPNREFPQRAALILHKHWPAYNAVVTTFDFWLFGPKVRV